MKKIATGGMAEIHIAKQRGMEGFEKIVVIKKILSHLANNQEFVQMFLDEARIAARLTHPNIVQIFDLGRASGTYFIAMEYVQGENLRTIAKHARKRKVSLPLEHIVKITSQACEGLHYAHNKNDTNGQPLGIVHRDISPQNIMVSFEGITKLVDFGIAKAATQFSETRAGVLKGKYSYMSPEQCRGVAIDARSDIFSMGIVLWELATGLRLYKKSSELLILKEITEGTVTPPRQVNQTIPAELEAIILKALEKNPDARFQNALQMHLALEEFLKNQGVTSSTIHISAFMRELFKDKLENIRKIEEAQASGDSLESFLFDDLNADKDMYVPGTGGTGVTPSSPSSASPISTPSHGSPGSQPLYPKPTTGISRIGPLPSGQPEPKRGRGLLLGGILVLLLCVLGALGYLIYEQLQQPPDKPEPKDAGVTVAKGKASIQVTSTPTEASVMVDGNRKGATPVDVADLELGMFYTLQVTKKGYRPWSTQFKLEEAGATRRFHARLEQIGKSGGWGWVEVSTRPDGATVTLDNRPVDGTTPLTINRVAAGERHTLRATLKGRESWVKTFTIRPNQRLKLEGTLPKGGEPRPTGKKAIYTLRSRPGGARFFLNGSPVRSNRLTLQPGNQVTVSARLNGYHEWSERVRPSSGERRTLVARLVRKEESTTGRGKASLSIDSTPWAVVYIDGVHIGTTPVANHKLKPGNHTARLVNNQIHSTKTFSFTAKPGEVIKKSVEFRKGRLQVRAKPWAHVSVHGRQIGTTPFEPKEMFEGKYKVVLNNPTLGRTIERSVRIKPGETTVLTVNFLE